jgi:hypothetical protein
MIPVGNVLVGLAGASFGLHPSLWGMSVLGIGTALVVASLSSVRALPRGVQVG